MTLFLCLSGMSLGRYCLKSLAKSEVFGKKIKGGGWSCRGLPTEGGGFQPSAHYGLHLHTVTACIAWIGMKSCRKF